jgi:hypothetical protein
VCLPFSFIKAKKFSQILDPDNYVLHHLSARLLCVHKLCQLLGKKTKVDIVTYGLTPTRIKFFSSTERFESIDKHGFYAYVDSSKI